MRPAFVAPIALAAAALAGPAAAQEPPVLDDPRINQLIIYGDDSCPPSTEDEIIVCARLPEDDRYRIPPNLREDPNDPANQSWANRAIELSYVGRTGIDSCSTVGPASFTGCFSQIVRQARADRAGAPSIDWERLIDQARQERLDRIQAEAEAEEQAERDAPQ